ncbi:MAG: hypothetical protein FIA95_05575 [Gemmatimonadetes bacterium]|nr:hypothetical protein [Gemmatimonadota bacterium]
MTTLTERRRSVAFLDHEDVTWACFLVTYPGQASARWHGFFSFRPGSGEAEEDEVRTADIFIEDSEAEIHEKARGLGRPLLNGLLASALHASRRKAGNAPRLRARFREMLRDNARQLAGDWTGPASRAPDEGELESLYASYRLDQVAHLICLLDPRDFERAVERILEGKRVDFRTTDLVQFSMMVVEHIEGLLPLPPFEVWAQDFLADPEAYRLYAHTLHREGRLP